MDEQALHLNKAVVRRFNQEVIEGGRAEAFLALVAPGFVNRTAPPWLPPGPEGMLQMFEEVLRPALPDLRVEIHAQVAEGDLVATRKTLAGTHRGPLLGIAPTGREVRIDVIDFVRLDGGRYAEHWGLNTLPQVLAALREGGSGSR
jgi:predicted SnoaL-like aldol condensation-catalyzing enzyme